MHRLEAYGVEFHYSGDGSGEVILRRADQAGGVLSVPASALVAFVGELVRGQKIRELEEAGARELLGLKR